LQNETLVLIRGNQEGYERVAGIDEPCSLFIHPLHLFFSLSLLSFLLPSHRPKYCTVDVPTPKAFNISELTVRFCWGSHSGTN